LPHHNILLLQSNIRLIAEAESLEETLVPAYVIN